MSEISIASLIPDAETLLELEPEELAGVLLEALGASGNTKFNPEGTIWTVAEREYSRSYRDRLNLALSEAWAWLEREALLVPSLGENRAWFLLSRRARSLRTRSDFESYRKAKLLPRARLHPAISEKVSSTFMRGHYDTAVFEAFKEVEVSVREAGGFSKTDIGIDLMRKAFAAGSGPLSDSRLPAAAQEALSHLFAGAIGRYKNPHSHRNESLDDPIETVEILLFACHLLRIVDAARARNIKG